MDIWAWAGRRRGTEGEVEKRTAGEGQEVLGEPSTLGLGSDTVSRAKLV